MGGKRKKGLEEFLFDTRAMLCADDRIAILIAAEMLSEALEKLLRARFTSEGLNSSLQNKLLGSFTSPMFSFGMRATVCRAFGLLPSDACDALELVRKMRNHCAHHTRDVSIKDQEMLPHVRALQQYHMKIKGVNRRAMPRTAINDSTVELVLLINRQEKELLRKTPKK